MALLLPGVVDADGEEGFGGAGRPSHQFAADAPEAPGAAGDRSDLGSGEAVLVPDDAVGHDLPATVKVECEQALQERFSRRHVDHAHDGARALVLANLGAALLGEEVVGEDRDQVALTETGVAEVDRLYLLGLRERLDDLGLACVSGSVARAARIRKRNAAQGKHPGHRVDQHESGLIHLNDLRRSDHMMMRIIQPTPGKVKRVRAPPASGERSQTSVVDARRFTPGVEAASTLRATSLHLWRRYLTVALQGLRPATPPDPLGVPAVSHSRWSSCSSAPGSTEADLRPAVGGAARAPATARGSFSGWRAELGAGPDGQCSAAP